MYVCMYVCMYACMYVCMYVCMCVWVCMYVMQSGTSEKPIPRGVRRFCRNAPWLFERPLSKYGPRRVFNYPYSTPHLLNYYSILRAVNGYDDSIPDLAIDLPHIE